MRPGMLDSPGRRPDSPRRPWSQLPAIQSSGEDEQRGPGRVATTAPAGYCR